MDIEEKKVERETTGNSSQIRSMQPVPQHQASSISDAEEEIRAALSHPRVLPSTWNEADENPSHHSLSTITMAPTVHPEKLQPPRPSKQRF